MRKVFFFAMIIAFVSGIAIAEERVVFEINAPVGSIYSDDAKLEVALRVVGQARSSRRRNLRARLRACPATGNARQDRGRCMKSRSR